MKKRGYYLLVFVAFIFALISTMDIAWAAEEVMKNDDILGEDGFANKSENFSKIILYVLIAGLAFSSYIFYKKSK